LDKDYVVSPSASGTLTLDDALLITSFDDNDAECDHLVSLHLSGATIHYDGDPATAASIQLDPKEATHHFAIRDDDGYDDGGPENNLFSIPYRKNACGNDPVHHGVDLILDDDRDERYGIWKVQSQYEGNYMVVGNMVEKNRIAPIVGGRYDPKANKRDVVRGWRPIPVPPAPATLIYSPPDVFAEGGVLGFTRNRGSGAEGDPKRQWCDRIDLLASPVVESVGKAVVRGNGGDIFIDFYDLSVSNWKWIQSERDASTVPALRRAQPCLRAGAGQFGPCPDQEATMEHHGRNDWSVRIPLLELPEGAWLGFAREPRCTWRFVGRLEDSGKMPSVLHNTIRIDLKNIHNEWLYECL